MPRAALISIPYILAMLIGLNVQAVEQKNVLFESLSSNVVDLQALFSQNPLEGYGVEIQPIKLEASFEEVRSISLEEILAQAIENNINLQIAKQDSLVAKWEFWNQFSTLLPDITFKANKNKRDGTFFLNSQISLDIDETQAQATGRIDYQIFSGGTKAFLTWAQRNFFKAIKENEKLEFNRTIRDSIKLYDALLKEQVSLSSQLSSLEASASNFRQAKQFFEAGTGTKFNVYQAEAELARAEQKLIEQEANFRQAAIQLAEHLNIDLETSLKIDTIQAQGFRKFNLIEMGLEIAKYIELAKENNPRIKSALLNRQGAYKEAYSKLGYYLPKINLFADYTGSGEVLDDLSLIKTFGIEAVYDIGKGLGLSRSAEFMESLNNAKRAKLLYEQELQSIEKDLRLAFLGFEKAKALINAAEKELIASREAVRLSRLRYENGVGVFTDVLDQQRDLSEAEIRYVTSVADYNDAQADLAFEAGILDIEKLTLYSH